MLSEAEGAIRLVRWLEGVSVRCWEAGGGQGGGPAGEDGVDVLRDGEGRGVASIENPAGKHEGEQCEDEAVLRCETGD